MIPSIQNTASKLSHVIDKGFQALSHVITSVARRALLGLINISLLNASSWRFKMRLDPKKINDSWDLFNKTGIKKQDSSVPSWKFSHSDMMKSFQDLGCRFQERSHHFDVFFDPKNEVMKEILKKYGISYEQNGSACQFKMGRPQNKTVIYCPGSGHIFEFRKQTIGYLTIQCGFDLNCFYYPGVQSHKGDVCRVSLDNCVENVLKHELKHRNEKDIILYGHCIGASILSHTATNHPNIPVVFDRSFDTITDLVVSSIQKKHLNFFPKVSRYLGNLAQSFYDFRLKQVIDNHPRCLLLYSSLDQFIPDSCKEPTGYF